MSIESVAMNISELSKLSGLSTLQFVITSKSNSCLKQKENRMAIVNIPIMI